MQWIRRGTGDEMESKAGTKAVRGPELEHELGGLGVPHGRREGTILSGDERGVRQEAEHDES